MKKSKVRKTTPKHGSTKVHKDKKKFSRKNQVEEICEYCPGVPLSECTGYKCWI